MWVLPPHRERGSSTKGTAMGGEQTLTEGEEHFITQLKERARLRDVPIDAALWEHPSQVDSTELTVVSNRRWYMVSLHPTDLTDPRCGEEIIKGLLTTIRHQLPFARVRR
jgi:hypothetical protein